MQASGEQCGHRGPDATVWGKERALGASGQAAGQLRQPARARRQLRGNLGQTRRRGKLRGNSPGPCGLGASGGGIRQECTMRLAWPSRPHPSVAGNSRFAGSRCGARAHGRQCERRASGWHSSAFYAALLRSRAAFCSGFPRRLHRGRASGLSKCRPCGLKTAPSVPVNPSREGTRSGCPPRRGRSAISAVPTQASGEQRGHRSPGASTGGAAQSQVRGRQRGPDASVGGTARGIARERHCGPDASAGELRESCGPGASIGGTSPATRAPEGRRGSRVGRNAPYGL